MGTYYGYKRGDNNKIVDFSSVTKELPKALAKIEEGRASERAAIEKDIQAAKEKMADVPIGNDQSANAFALNTANGLADNLRTQTILLRNGKKKPSDFTIYRQNSVDGMAGLKRLADGYNAKINNTVTRLEANKSGWLEAVAVERLQKRANFSNTKAYQDENGVLRLAEVDSKGNIDKSKGESVNTLENLLLQEYDKFDVDGKMTAIASTYGKELRVLNGGKVLTRDDVLQKPGIDAAIETSMGQYRDEDYASVLQDYAHLGYEKTEDIAVRDGDPSKYILLAPDGDQGNRLTPVLNDEQKEKAKEILKEQLLTKLGVVETARPEKTPTQPSTQQQAKNAAIQKTTSSLNTLKEFFTADTEAKRSNAIAGIKGLLGEKFVEMTMNPDKKGATLQYYERIKDANGKDADRLKSVQVPLNGTFDEFVKSYGEILTGTGDINTYYNEIATDPAVSALTPNTTVVGSYKVTIPEAAVEPEEITPWADMADSIVLGEDYDSHEAVSADATNIAQSFIADSKIANAEVIEDFDNKTITLKLGGKVVATITKTGDDADDLQPRLVSALRSLHAKANAAGNAAGAGNGKPATMSLQEIKDANPGLSLQEHMKMFKAQ